jgi:hypothetical protein
MGGNRKHGFMRGAHHVKNWWEKPFFCDGCQKTHGPKVERFQMIGGRMLCNRQYNKELDKKQAAFDRPSATAQ